MLNLQSTYPYVFRKKDLYKLIGILFIASYIFNYLFEPYSVYRPEHKMGYHWICLIHTIFPLVIVYSYFSILNIVEKRRKRMTLGEYILHLSIVCLLIGVENFLIRDIIYDNPHNWSFRYFMEEVRNAYLSTSLLTLLVIPIYTRISYSSEQLNQDNELSTGRKIHSIWIKTQLKTDDFQLDLNRFLFAQAEGNYVAFYCQIGETYEKNLKRMTLKELEHQLSSFSNVIKTHRAYLVHASKIREIKGNSRGYQLCLQIYPEKIPVSRGMVENFDKLISEGIIHLGISSH